MVACGPRTDAYARAIARTVKPGSIVLDIGAGTGVLSLLAAKAGARKVYAVEPNPAVWLLPELAAENGVEDRIEVHQISSLDLVIPEKVDVVIADLRGSFPITGDHLSAMFDARTRLLADGGVIIPESDALRVAVVEARALHADLESAANALSTVGLKGAAAARSIFNSVTNDSRGPLRTNDLLTEGRVWQVLEYGRTRGPFDKTVQLKAVRNGIARGLALWFDAHVQDELTFDSQPGSDMVYARGYLPFPEPIPLDAHDVVTVTLRVDEQGTRWAWDTTVSEQDSNPKVSFRQASFLGMPTSPEALLKGSAKFVPQRSARGERQRYILDLMDGTRTVRDIVQIAGDAFPEQSAARIADEVHDLIGSCSR